MYQSRFHSTGNRRLLHWDGRFSLTHLGRGAFLYTFPGKYNPVVGRIDLTRKKYRLHGLSVLVLTITLTGTLLFMSHDGTANSRTGIQGIENLKPGMNPDELERRSEEVKNRILSQGEPAEEGQEGVAIRRYTIQPGDTLASLSQRFKIAVDLLAASSNIQPHTVLRPGQTLNVPSKSGLVYRVQKGETLASVAERYSVKLESLVKDNPGLADLDIIEPGTRVFLPNAKIPAPPSPWGRPAFARITSGFGWRLNPLTGHRQFHGGIDIGIHFSPVHAAREGEVIFAGYLGSYGNAVVIQHKGGYKTLYAHMSMVKVRIGQYVTHASVLGISGNTGMSTGPHLHFEIIKNGRAINPRPFVHL